MQLFQDETQTHRYCTYTLHKNRSFTDSRESYQNGASKETLILRWNKRIPTQEFVLHFLTVFSGQELRTLRRKIFRYLKDHGLEAVASIELTKGKNGRPNNCVHFTILTDDPRSEAELRALLETACERQGIVNKTDFCVSYQYLPDGYGRFNYFTKYAKKYVDEVILFQPKLLQSGKTIQKFYQIGKWFHKSKALIWKDIKAYMEAKYGIDPDKSKCANTTEQEAINEVVPSTNAPSLPEGIESDLEGCEAVSANDMPTDDTMPVEAHSESLCETYSINIEEVLEGDKAAVAEDSTACCFDPEIHTDCLFPHIIPDHRRDWERYKFSVAFRQ